MIKGIRAVRCEKIPEKEFEKHKEGEEFLSVGWEEMTRKDGFVYIVYEPRATGESSLK